MASIGLFQNKKIIVLSPQPWNHLFISKHQYARTLAKYNDVYFIEPPVDGRKFHFISNGPSDINRLNVVSYFIPLPYWFRFKLPRVYKLLVRFYLKRVLTAILGKADLCFDFGCYQLFDSTNFISADKKIYFPVDDMKQVTGEMRGSSFVFTVSSVILSKFEKGTSEFINHGLSEEFAKITRRELGKTHFRQHNPIKVGYAGNLFLQYFDIDIVKELILLNPGIEFHFFGSKDANLSIDWQFQWNVFLEQTPNVKIRGVLGSTELAMEFMEMDLFLLCYKPDYINYHGENSHKILEYLSTGKAIVSTHITHYEKTSLIQMAEKNKGQDVIGIFNEVVSNLEFHNSPALMDARRVFALDNTYEKQIERIGNFLTRLEKTKKDQA